TPDHRRALGELRLRSAVESISSGVAPHGPTPREPAVREVLEEAALPSLRPTDAGIEVARRERAALSGRPLPLVILMSDMVGSTAMIEQLGERRAHDVMQRHNAITRQCFREYGAREVNFTGDGFLATHTSAVRALQ